MTTPFESLDDTFNVSPTEETTDIVEVESAELVSGSKADDREDDYQYARGQLHNIIEKMQMTLDGALEVAQESDHPRAFEVAFNGAKHLADVVDKLQDLHAKEKKISEEQSGGGSSVNHGTVNNVYMTGTTADMLKMLKEAKEQDK
ncbi:terminase small subunit [Synechococcus phage S-H34]|uniref:Terminase small subunit n=1 Tax=Synechococcus phage S-H34 TaxID=2718942 RepID=A0A6G8R678_9CAUD|nr:terminase small subunit [Synechococcus phage S-H34]QIN96905.1 terminase small subunit [Synechococcus phage S-H34]